MVMLCTCRAFAIDKTYKRNNKAAGGCNKFLPVNELDGAKKMVDWWTWNDTEMESTPAWFAETAFTRAACARGITRSSIAAKRE